ncbi:Translocating chain-associated membrane protein 2 [Triplophysa tibetana]|uniref:Translocating chain-associated membrane protein 2 n=1 Tax=Triplophysa tibetana TaxID=1572043 RepID=A0A5A9NHE9_9TELE|nr:Translocating chain-associated membrane protein 2 [Triplophysa tibetana]
MAFRRRNKSYPFFSQEFLIQNHADIVFSLVILVLIGLMFETTAKTAILFIQPQFNISTVTADGEVTLYHYGWKDCATVLFYLFITIILHAVVQEYVLDKINRRLHLSKSKNTKFNESGQLCVFYLVSSVWSLFQVKFFYITQLAYWFHALPELYFQKVRKIWSVGFVVTRMITLTLMFLAVGFGLARSENQTLDLETGNFNTLSIRLLVLLVVCFTQSWLLWKFFRFQLSRTRELRLEQAARKRAVAKQQMQRTLKRDSRTFTLLKLRFICVR